MKKLNLKLITLITSIILLAGCNPAPAHVHTFSSEWSKDETNHWHAATCEHDVKSGEEAHSFGEWIIDREATEERVGEKHRTCSICEYVQVEEITYVKKVDATRLYLSTTPNSSSIHVGSTRTLSPVVFPNDATKNIKYVSEDESVLTVDEEGTLTGVGEGTALIKVFNDNNDNGSCDDTEPFGYACYSIVEPDPDKYISLDKTEVTIKVGEEVSVKPSAKGFSANFYSYSNYVYDSSIANAYENKIKGLKPGVTGVNFSAKPSGEDTPYEAICKVTVVDNVDSSGTRAHGVNFSLKEKTLNINEAFTPEYRITPSNAVDTVASISSNNSCVEISDGTILAKSSGTSIITIKTSNGKFDRMKIVVVDGTQTYDKEYNNYYGDLTWENGQDLKEKLHNIISTNKKNLKYNGTVTNWDSNKDADSLIGDDSKVSALYTDDPIDKSATNSGWQREHCFAASLMTGVGTGDAVKTLGRATDFHNLYAASASGNTSRGNKNFGYADTLSLRYKTKDGCNIAYDDKNFEPADSDKGKVARAIFYMGVMYNNSDESYKDSGIQFNAQPLEIVEDYVNYVTYDYSKFSNTDLEQCVMFANKYKQIVESDSLESAYKYYKTSNMTSAIGNLSDLLMWNSFLVDAQEMQHNNSVYSYNSSSGGGIQGNRNPFVDYPELVEYVYGSLKDKPGSISALKPAISYIDTDIPTPPGPGPTGDSDGSSIEKCAYSYVPTAGNKADYSGSGTSYVATFGAQQFDVTFGAEVDTFKNKNTDPAGVTIGKAAVPVGSLIFVSKSSFTAIEDIYFTASGAKDTQYDWVIKVNDEEVLKGKTNGTTVTAFGGELSSPKSGIVTIEITNITKAINFGGIGIHYAA